jgi:hypothetical protein
VQEYIPVNEDPPVDDDPPTADQSDQEDRMDPPAGVAQPVIPIRVPHRHNTKLQERRNMAEHTLVATGVPEIKVKLSGSAVDSITAHLEKRKREGTVDPSANVSVRQALKTRGEDAERDIIKELTQMDVLDNREPATCGENGGDPLLYVPDEEDPSRWKLRQVQGALSSRGRYAGQETV